MREELVVFCRLNPGVNAGQMKHGRVRVQRRDLPHTHPRFRGDDYTLESRRDTQGPRMAGRAGHNESPSLEGRRQPSGRADQRDGLPLVPAIDAEVGSIHGDDAVSWVELAHSNQAEVRQVGVPV
jgi:hypothetical protein